MSLRGKAAVVGIGETPVDRLGRKPGEPKKSTAEYLAWAARLAMEDAGLTKRDFDGQGLAAVYTTNHPQPFWPGEAANILGRSHALSLARGHGGASGVSLLGRAAAMSDAFQRARPHARRDRRHARLRDALRRDGAELQDF